MTRISPAELDAPQRVRAAILPRGRHGYAVPRVARVSPGCRARQRVWPRTLAKIRAHGRGWVKTGHFAGFAVAFPVPPHVVKYPYRRRSRPSSGVHSRCRAARSNLPIRLQLCIRSRRRLGRGRRSRAPGRGPCRPVSTRATCDATQLAIPISRLHRNTTMAARSDAFAATGSFTGRRRGASWAASQGPAR